MTAHDCAYEHDGVQCPKLGVHTEAPKPDGNESWYCAYHADRRNRGHGWADKRMLQAIIEDVRDGKQTRGTAAVSRETDELVDAELKRLDLARAGDESRSDFVGRCLAAVRLPRNSPMAGVLILAKRDDDALRLALLEAGEDPDAGLEETP